MILFPVVFAIWGYTFYKYFLYEPDPQTASGLTAIATGVGEKNSFSMELDSFKLLEEYRDPFLGRRRSGKQIVSEVVNPASPVQPVNPRVKPVKPEPAINWDIFRYSGMVKETGKAQMVGLLSIQGKLHSVTSGDRIAGAEVLWLNEDSLGILFKEESHTVKK